jgi:predicted phosphodiesterase
MKKLFAVLFYLSFAGLSLAQEERIAIKHGPYLQNLNETEVTIVWVVNKPSIGWVEVAPDDSSNFYYSERPKYFNVTNGVKNTSLLHAVKLTGLTPGTKYRYRVYSQEILEHQSWEIIYGRVAATGVYGVAPLSFTTGNRNKAETSFIVLNDIHGRVDDIPKMLKVAGLENTDMVIFNGDMVSNLKKEEDVFNGFMDESVKLFAREIPVYYARGNHETRGPYATFFQHYFSPKEPHLYYLVRQGPVCFVVLDTGEDKPDSDIEYSGITDYDNYRTEQARWLAQAVKSKDFTEARFKIVIAHIPPVSNAALWHGEKEVLEKFVPILNQAGIDVMLSGHQHYYMNKKPNSDIKFPIIVNAHKTVLKGTANDNKLELVVKDLEGKIIDQMILK